MIVYSLNVANLTVLIDDARTVRAEVGLQNNALRRHISSIVQQHNVLALRLYQSQQDPAIPLWIADKEAPIPEHLEDYNEVEDNANENFSHYVVLLQRVGKTSLAIWLCAFLLVPVLERCPGMFYIYLFLYSILNSAVDLYIALGRPDAPDNTKFFTVHLTIWVIAIYFVYYTLR